MSKAELTYQAARNRNWPAGINRKRKQLEQQRISLKEESQTAQWLFAALLFFDGIPHGSLSNLRELRGILSKIGSAFSGHMLNGSNYAKKYLLLAFKVKNLPSARGPPLLKSWLFKISEYGGLPYGKAILHKKGPGCLWPGH